MSRSPGIVVAIDIGTSAVKAGVFTADGRRLGYGTAPAPSLRPRPGWSEQPAMRIWQATAGACRQALAEAGSPKIEAVAVTGARGSFALADRDGTLLTEFITWQDRRALGQAAAAAALADAGWLQRITGVRMDASLWLPRLLWLIEHRRDLVAAAGCIVTPQAFVIGRLGAGHWPAEWSAAAYSGLFDIADHRWHEGLVDTFSVPSGLLPATLPPGAEAGRTSPAAGIETALPPRVPIVLAAADGPCAELGCGVVEPGRLICYLGTALSVAGPVERRIEDPSGNLITAPGSTRSLYRVLALGMAGASVLDWYGKLVGRPVLDRLDALMEGSVPGAGGARFIPALAGSGAPHWSAEARGAFLDLGVGHTEADLVRALLEGVAFECFWMIETLRPLRLRPRRSQGHRRRVALERLDPADRRHRWDRGRSARRDRPRPAGRRGLRPGPRRIAPRRSLRGQGHRRQWIVPGAFARRDRDAPGWRRLLPGRAPRLRQIRLGLRHRPRSAPRWRLLARPLRAGPVAA